MIGRAQLAWSQPWAAGEALLTGKCSTNLVRLVARWVLRHSSHDPEITILPKCLCALGVFWSGRSGVVSNVQFFFYLSLSSMMFRMDFRIFKFFCRALAAVFSLVRPFGSCCRSFNSSGFFVLFKNVGHKTSNVLFFSFWLLAVPITLSFASHLFGDVCHTTDFFASVLLAACLHYLKISACVKLDLTSVVFRHLWSYFRIFSVVFYIFLRLHSTNLSVFLTLTRLFKWHVVSISFSLPHGSCCIFYSWG